MTRFALSIAAMALLLCLGAAPSRAQTYGNAKWCAVVNLGVGEVQWDCEYNTVEDCTPNVLAGNRGFCNLNPYWKPPQAVPVPATRRKHTAHPH